MSPVFQMELVMFCAGPVLWLQKRQNSFPGPCGLLPDTTISKQPHENMCYSVHSTCLSNTIEFGSRSVGHDLVLEAPSPISKLGFARKAGFTSLYFLRDRYELKCAPLPCTLSTPLFGETYLRSQDPKKMASPTSATKVYPSGISPPLEVVTATNRGGIIGVTTTVALAIVLLIALPTGMYIRIRSSAYRADYYIFLAAVLVFLLQTTAVYIELSGGFGKVMDLVPVKNWNRIDKAGYVADVLYLITMFLSKCSTASIFLRLTPGRGHSIAVKTILAAMTAWIVMAIFVICLRCQPAEPWLDTTNAECPNLYSRWAVIGALDMISELALFGMSLYLVWNIRMAMKSKLTVVGAFASRLPIIALAAVRLHYLHIQLDSTDPSFDAANTVALTQFELGYGIFACIIPVMKPFLASHEGPLPNEGYTGDNYNLSTFGGGKSNAKNSQFDSSQEGTLKDGNYNTLGSQTDVGGSTKRLKLRPEHTSYQAGASRHDKQHDTRSLDSSDSQLMIIQKNVDFTVQYDSTPSTADKVGKV